MVRGKLTGSLLTPLNCWQPVPVVLAGDYNDAPMPQDIYPTRPLDNNRIDSA